MNIRAITRKGFVLLAIAVMAVTPVASFSTVSADDGCVAPADSTYGNGVHHPTGSEGAAFSYRCDVDGATDRQYAGQWTSDHYIYNPATNSTKPKEATVYTYNNTTNAYDFDQWIYVAGSNSYTLVHNSTATPPAGAQKVGGPSPAPVASASKQPTSASGTTSDPANSIGTATTNNINNTGSGSSNAITNGADNNAGVTNNSSATVTNTIGSVAATGNAVVLGNTTGGNATSGNAITQANVQNMLQSSSNALGSGTDVARFTYTINGDVTGDLFFDPSLINNVQGDTTVDNTLTNNLTINNTSDSTINNNLDLSTVTGDASVTNNTSGGNATSGDARSVANIVNMINSAVTAGKSFVGTINITGNLNGDILLPDNFVDQLIASNVPTIAVSGPNSDNSVNNNTTNNSTVTNTNNQGINNTVNSTAKTGGANTSGNTNAGGATAGSANTNVEAFNLTGSKVVAKNSILVFVNVLGKWTGLIVNAPAGATAAQLGGGVSNTGPSSRSSVTSTANGNATLNNTTKQQINNDVAIGATSGNANVSGNTKGGDATSGNAQTAVNIVNYEDSTLDLSDWFGVLYINVFGTWNGSFGVNTAAGNVASRGSGSTGTMLVGNISKLVKYPAITTPAVTRPTGRGTTTTANNAAPPTTNGGTTTGSVLAAKTVATIPTKPTTPQLDTTKSSNLLLPALGVVVGLLILGSERLLARRRS